MKLLLLIATVILFYNGTIFSQNRPFPMDLGFEGCTKPSVTQRNMDSTISEYYKYLKDTYISPSKNTPGGYYVLSGGGTGGDDNLITISEGHGYGMIMFVLMAGNGEFADPEAQQYFDGMFNFYADHPSKICNDLMSWQVLDNGSGGEDFTRDDAATDGDMDVAYALLLADYQWGSSGTINYLKEAKNIIKNGIKEYETNQANYRIMLGDWVYSEDDWGNISLDDSFYWATRTSDWMCDHLRAFETATEDDYWAKAVSEIYSMFSYFTENYSQKTGLISDFVDGKDVEPVPEFFIDEFKETNQYYENACRVPLRIATDYVHYGSSDAKEVLSKMVDWVTLKTDNDPSNITFGYDIETGDELHPEKKSMQFTAPFVAASIIDSSYKDFLNAGWNLMIKDRDSYYPDFLNFLSMLLISGNWWPAEDSLPKTEIKNYDKAYDLGNEFSIVTTGSLIKLMFRNYSPQKYTVSLFSLNGEQLKSVTSQKKTILLNISGIPNGVYVLALGSKSTSFSQKIILR